MISIVTLSKQNAKALLCDFSRGSAFFVFQSVYSRRVADMRVKASTPPKITRGAGFGAYICAENSMNGKNISSATADGDIFDGVTVI